MAATPAPTVVTPETAAATTAAASPTITVTQQHQSHQQLQQQRYPHTHTRGTTVGVPATSAGTTAPNRNNTSYKHSDRGHNRRSASFIAATLYVRPQPLHVLIAALATTPATHRLLHRTRPPATPTAVGTPVISIATPATTAATPAATGYIRCCRLPQQYTWQHSYDRCYSNNKRSSDSQSGTSCTSNNYATPASRVTRPATAAATPATTMTTIVVAPAITAATQTTSAA